MVRIRPLVAVVAAALVLVTAAACSSSKSSAPPPETIGPNSSLPGSDGYTCDDPTGDIGSALDAVGTLTEPSGIDLTKAEAHIGKDSLTVTYTTVGPIASAPEPFFQMFQGNPAAPQLGGIDLRTEPKGEGGAWVLSLGTTPATGRAETFTVLPYPVFVKDNVLTYEVPLSAIPPITTLQWSFGATSTQSNSSVLFDDCSSIPSPTNQTAPPIVTVPPSTEN